MAQYTAPEEIKSEAHVVLWIYARDFFFLLIFGYVAYALVGMVAKPFQIFYIIFTIVYAILFTIPSPFNKKRRIYQSLLIYLKKDISIYHPITGKEERGE